MAPKLTIPQRPLPPIDDSVVGDPLRVEGGGDSDAANGSDEDAAYDEAGEEAVSVQDAKGEGGSDNEEDAPADEEAVAAPVPLVHEGNQTESSAREPPQHPMPSLVHVGMPRGEDEAEQQDGAKEEVAALPLGSLMLTSPLVGEQEAIAEEGAEEKEEGVNGEETVGEEPPPVANLLLTSPLAGEERAVEAELAQEAAEETENELVERVDADAEETLETVDEKSAKEADAQDDDEEAMEAFFEGDEEANTEESSCETAKWHMAPKLGKCTNSPDDISQAWLRSPETEKEYLYDELSGCCKKFFFKDECDAIDVCTNGGVEGEQESALPNASVALMAKGEDEGEEGAAPVDDEEDVSDADDGEDIDGDASGDNSSTEDESGDEVDDKSDADTTEGENEEEKDADAASVEEKDESKQQESEQEGINAADEEEDVPDEEAAKEEGITDEDAAKEDDEQDASEEDSTEGDNAADEEDAGGDNPADEEDAEETAPFDEEDAEEDVEKSTPEGSSSTEGQGGELVDKPDWKGYHEDINKIDIPKDEGLDHHGKSHDVSEAKGIEGYEGDGFKFHVLRPKGQGSGVQSTPLGVAGALLAAVLICFCCCRYRRNKNNVAHRGKYSALHGGDDFFDGTFSDDISFRGKDSDDEMSTGSYGSDEEYGNGTGVKLELGGIHETDANGGLTLREING